MILCGRGDLMHCKVTTAIMNGYEGQVVEIESAITPGLPSFSIIGLANTTVKEAVERIRAALKYYKVTLPPKRIVINLSPADLRKSGAHLDLGITMTLLPQLNVVKMRDSEKYSYLGEMTLDGNILPLKGILVLLEALRHKNIQTVFVPKANYIEASYIEEMTIIPVGNLGEVIEYMNEGLFPKVECIENSNKVSPPSYLDYRDIKGQEGAKRALSIALCGGHNLLLVGPPGTGKTMLASNAPSLLPALTLEESIELAKIYGAGGRDGGGFIRHRRPPFRSPHHSIGKAALIGGGRIPQPGEISLAHRGILFLDELGEFKNEQLELLREPLENKAVNIVRLGYHTTFPAKFTLLAAMNPCKCGYYGSRLKNCSCPPHLVAQGFRKLSKPLLDRIDMIYWVNDVSIEALNDEDGGHSTTTKQLKSVIAKGLSQQFEMVNSAKKYQWPIESQQVLEQGYVALSLSPRTYHKVIKIAETIAAMAGNLSVEKAYVLEALQFRKNEQLFKGETCI